jgi:hypothetical protein
VVLIKEYSPTLPYYTLYDDNILNAATQDSLGFINRIDRAIIMVFQKFSVCFVALGNMHKGGMRILQLDLVNGGRLRMQSTCFLGAHSELPTTKAVIVKHLRSHF